MGVISNNIVAKEIAEKRIAICRQCPHYLKSIKVCRICGCVMPIKTRLKEVECADRENIRWHKEP
jgi:hypothetical protein